MKILLICMILSSCYALNEHALYNDSKHSIIQIDSAVDNGKIIYRVFTCENNCGFVDTFPNPSFDSVVKAYTKLTLARHHTTGAYAAQR